MEKRKGGLIKIGEIAIRQGLNEPKIATSKTIKAVRFSEPTAPEFNNPQLSLFQNFLFNTDEQRDGLSNAIDLWDNVPRYSISRQAMTKARINNQFLPRHESLFQHKNVTYTRTIAPARVKDLDGVERDYYPSATEELVEDALRKLAIEQRAGYFDKPNYRSGVVFTLYALREEMKKRGHSRSYQELVLALNILTGSVIEITGVGDKKGEILARSTYLSSLVAVSRSRLKDDPKAKWAVQFHPLVTNSIDKLTYRQFNYHLMMSHTTQLARWLHKQLVLKYTFASMMNPFEMRYSTIKRDSGMLDSYSRDRDAADAVEAALTELKKREVISTCTRSDVKGARKKLLDVVFKILPSYDFVRDTKAASKRLMIAPSVEPGNR